jgi:hypothetical protein
MRYAVCGMRPSARSGRRAQGKKRVSGEMGLRPAWGMEHGAWILEAFDDVKQKSAKQYKNSLGIFAKLALITWRAYGEQNF